MKDESGYRPVIGLEVHVQLDTERKLFAPEGFRFGEKANQSISPLTIAHPGTLPFTNRACIDLAMRMGLATNCRISTKNWFARKNYFYPDLPKGYQISQDVAPICTDGHIELYADSGALRVIRIERIHIEEDAGKSIHDQDPSDSLVDLNRAGVPLIEIVSYPDLQSPEEASAYLAEIRRIVRFTGVGDGDMEKGSLRCDANISVMRHSDTEFGTRVEIKNINSITQLGKAIAFEIQRQINLLKSGEAVVQQTRTWDAVNGRTLLMREKESADDYRYFPEPDLLPVSISQEMIALVRADLPEMPRSLYRRYTEVLKIPHAEALALIESKDTTDYLKEMMEAGAGSKSATNWLLGPVRAWLNEKGKEISGFPLPAQKMAQLIALLNDQKVSFSSAKDHVFPEMILHPQRDPHDIAKKKDVLMDSSIDDAEQVMDRLITEYPTEVQRYRNGKKGLISFFVGQVMRQLKGKGNPKAVNEIVRKKLEE